MTGARANGDDRARGLTGAAEWADGGKRGVGAHPSRPAGNNAGDRRTAGGWPGGERRGAGETRRPEAANMRSGSPADMFTYVGEGGRVG
jgi:hypothetical protein